MEKFKTCCFTGHRPSKLPWGFAESDPRCQQIKAQMASTLDTLYQKGFRTFISGMALGADLYFAEAVLDLAARRPDVQLEGAVPCRSQADRWPEPQRRRWRSLLNRCHIETLVQECYDRQCMYRRDRYMVDRSSAILALFDGSQGGTQYTLNYAASRHLSIILLDPHRPQQSPLWLEAPSSLVLSAIPAEG